MSILTTVAALASAVLSFTAVIMVARLNHRVERQQWLRDERVKSVVDLKLAVSKLRVRYSHVGRSLPGLDQGVEDFDFSEVNTAMAKIDLVGTTDMVADVNRLRKELRTFVQRATRKDSTWRESRDNLDKTVDRIVSATRKGLM